MLFVRLTDGNWPREYEIPVRIKPPLMTPVQRAAKDLEEQIKEMEQDSRYESAFSLPQFQEGNRLSYDIPGGLPPILSLTALGLAGAFLITLKETVDLKNRRNAADSRCSLTIQRFYRVLSFSGGRNEYPKCLGTDCC